MFKYTKSIPGAAPSSAQTWSKYRRIPRVLRSTTPGLFVGIVAVESILLNKQVVVFDEK